MIALYPVLLACAVGVAGSRRHSSAGFGWSWFGAWAGAGALFVFSFLTGFSIGLALLPAAAALLLWVSAKSPHAPEALGFLVGVGVDLLLVAAIPENGAGAGWYSAGAPRRSPGCLALRPCRNVASRRAKAADKITSWRGANPRRRALPAAATSREVASD